MPKGQIDDSKRMISLIENMPLNIGRLEEINRGTGWHSHYHSHDFYEICYVVSGKGTISVEGVTYKVSAGDIYLYYRREPDLQLLEKWEHDYWNKVKAETIPFPETELVLENLVSKYQIALITNTERQEPRKKHRLSQFPGLKKFFKVIIIAGESGVPPKPDCIPFLLCLRKLGIAPAEAIYVGDDWRIDICGARDAGIQPIWLQHRLVQRTWPAVKTPVPVITSLECLLDLERVLS